MKVVGAVKCSGVEVEALQVIILTWAACVSNTVIAKRNHKWIKAPSEADRAIFGVLIFKTPASVDAV